MPAPLEATISRGTVPSFIGYWRRRRTVNGFSWDSAISGDVWISPSMATPASAASRASRIQECGAWRSAPTGDSWPRRRVACSIRRRGYSRLGCGPRDEEASSRRLANTRMSGTSSFTPDGQLLVGGIRVAAGMWRQGDNEILLSRGCKFGSPPVTTAACGYSMARPERHSATLGAPSSSTSSPEP